MARLQRDPRREAEAFQTASWSAQPIWNPQITSKCIFFSFMTDFVSCRFTQHIYDGYILLSLIVYIFLHYYTYYEKRTRLSFAWLIRYVLYT